MWNQNLNTQYNLTEWKLSKEKVKGESHLVAVENKKVFKI